MPPSHTHLHTHRVPFLLAFLTAGSALLLRMHMEEPDEFLAAKAAAAAAREGRKAAALEAGDSRPPSAAGAAGGGAGAAAANGVIAKDSGSGGGGGGEPSGGLGGHSFVLLLRDHWREVVLQFGFETRWGPGSSSMQQAAELQAAACALLHCSLWRPCQCTRQLQPHLHAAAHTHYTHQTHNTHNMHTHNTHAACLSASGCPPPSCPASLVRRRLTVGSVADGSWGGWGLRFAICSWRRRRQKLNTQVYPP